MKVSELYTYAPKSKMKTSLANNGGAYQFFTSSSEEDKRCNDYLYNAEAIIMGTGGSASLHYYNGKFSTSTDCLVLIPNEKVMPKYLYYYFLGSMGQLEAGFHGAGLKHTSKGYIDNLEVSNIPSSDKQREIVTIFDSVKSNIEKRKHQIAQLDNLIKARFVEMFESLKEYRKVGDFCDLQNGYSFKSGDYIDKSTTLNCRMSNIRPGGFFASDYHPKFLPDAYWDSYSEFRLNDNDVIIAMTDMASDPKILGIPTIVKTNGQRFLLNQRVGKLIFNENARIDRVYLLNALMQDNVRKELVQNSGGSTQINIGKPAILNLTIKYPPIDLQNQFATFVHQVDKSKFAIQTTIQHLRCYLAIVIDVFFASKKGLNNKY